MGFLQDIFREIKNFLTVWITIPPWEAGIRVRRGKYMKLLEPGMHICWPVIDAIYTQGKRLRFCDLPIQTLTTKDGHTVTLKGMLGYKIINIQKLYDRLQHPETAMVEIVTGAVAGYVYAHDRGFQPGEVSAAVLDKLDFTKYGIGGIQFQITDFAYVRALRLIQGDNYYAVGDKLRTDEVTTASGY